MPELTLTDFVDVVSKAGTPKITKVKQLKNRPAYHPSHDFYKPFRDHVVKIHRTDLKKARLDRLIPILADKNKINNYPGLITGYKRFWGRKNIKWFEPTSVIWSANGVDLRVNPELGLEFGGNQYLIKLYMKSDPLAKARIDIITHLMDTALRPQVDESVVMAVLDVRTHHLITPTVPIPAIHAGLLAEMAYISALWPSV